MCEPLGKNVTPSWFTNAWPRAFFTRAPQAGKDDVPAVEARSRIGCLPDKLTNFLEGSEDIGFPSEADGVKRYCRNLRLKDIEDGVGDAGTRKALWIDDRKSDNLTGSGSSRHSNGWMTATRALRYLEQSRYDLDKEPDAERRLICVSDLTPEFICALAITAPFHYAPVLRDTLCKHVDFKPSIMVQIPSDGKPKFQMEFHLPYFALRKHLQPDGLQNKPPTHSLRRWEDLSLIDGETSMPGGQEVYRLHEAQASLCLYGPNEWQWTACAFLDNAYESGSLYDYEETHDGEGEDREAVGDQKAVEFVEDPIATGLDASNPIWRPRQYFAFAFEVNVREISREWRELVHKMECDINASKHSRTFAYSNASQNSSERSDEIKRSFHWTQERMRLLGKLINVLSGSIQQWRAFKSQDGDIEYFSDLQHPIESRYPEFEDNCHVGRSLRAINKTFANLECLLQKLELLRTDLKNDFKTLTLRLSVEGHDANENASFTSFFSIRASTIFSMQPTVIPFALTPFWFLLTIFILIGGMPIIYWFIKKWASWQNKFAGWKKRRQDLEEEGPHGSEGNYRQFIPRTFRSRTADDEESLGTRNPCCAVADSGCSNQFGSFTADTIGDSLQIDFEGATIAWDDPQGR
ncbi:hypothetical protein N431DRAFT_504241 [Stipitochalara longipes BDJ]|nr:hypothetical protein N431DRAFT_504241 [Stipitochalara longipes BDJ]